MMTIICSWESLGKPPSPPPPLAINQNQFTFLVKMLLMWHGRSLLIKNSFCWVVWRTSILSVSDSLSAVVSIEILITIFFFCFLVR